jgi:hypothetical protein
MPKRIDHRKGSGPPKAKEREIRIEPLIPSQVCGNGTTVAELYRVRERVGASLQVHLVFLDRHGLYCDHGTGCPAVADVRKFRKGKQTANKNGWMRA